MPLGIFISHTKQEAATALVLKRFIDERYGEEAGAFVSETDISAGTRWLEHVESTLRSAKLVIVLCSPRSVRKPWVMFEAGGAWSLGVPILPICHSGLNVSDLQSPLSNFQALSLSAPDFTQRLDAGFKLHLGLIPLSTADVAAVNAGIDGAARAASVRHHLFVSAPMSSVESYRAFRGSLEPVLAAIRRQPELSRYYFSGQQSQTDSDFDEAFVGAERDLRALADSDRFMMVLPQRLASSTLVEAGFALALGIPAVIFAADLDFLPYALRDVGQVATAARVVRYKTVDDVANTINKYGAGLWPKSWGYQYS